MRVALEVPRNQLCLLLFIATELRFDASVSAVSILDIKFFTRHLCESEELFTK